MQKFNYVALDAQGKEQKGVVEANDQNQAITALRQHNLFPQSVTPVGGTAKTKSKSLGAKEINIKMPAFLRGRVKAKDLMVQESLKAYLAADQVGYESSSQFSREFKRHFGQSPAEMVRELRAT